MIYLFTWRVITSRDQMQPQLHRGEKITFIHLLGFAKILDNNVKQSYFRGHLASHPCVSLYLGWPFWGCNLCRSHNTCIRCQSPSLRLIHCMEVITLLVRGCWRLPLGSAWTTTKPSWILTSNCRVTSGWVMPEQSTIQVTAMWADRGYHVDLMMVTMVDSHTWTSSRICDDIHNLLKKM